MDLDLHVRIARVLGLLCHGNRVDVFRVGGVGDINALGAGLINQGFDQVMRAFVALVADDAGERILPLTGFLRIYIHG